MDRINANKGEPYQLNDTELRVPLRLNRRSLLVCLVTSTAAGCKSFADFPGTKTDSLKLPLSGERDKSGPRLISEVCRIRGINFAVAEGIGLAFGLKDTGSDPRPGATRDQLLRELKTLNLDVNIETLLAGKDTSLVLVKGLIPPGAKKGDKFDLEVGTMPRTDTTSIEYGVLAKTSLRPMVDTGRNIQQGNMVGTASGRILIDALFETRQDESNQLHGYILGGGTVQQDRDFGLELDTKVASTKLSIAVARAVNSRFSYSDRSGRHPVADPKSDAYIALVTPEEYRHNFGRYLQVVINIFHSESASLRLQRMEKLETELMVPETSEYAAIQLEAIGRDGIPILKRAMRHDDLEVKFYAAQALAYQGESDGIEHLRFVAEKEPAFRWHALTALSTLKVNEAAESLKYLLHVNSAETRYGAFRALMAHSPSDPVVTADLLGDFHFVQIVSQTPSPLIHFSRRKRNEIVLFGHQQTVATGFDYRDSKVSIKLIDANRISITRHTPDGDQRLVVSNRVAELIEGMHRAGLTYGDQIKVFRKAKLANTLNSKIVVDATPRLGRTYVPGQFSAEPKHDEFNNLDKDDNVEFVSTATKAKRGATAAAHESDSDLDQETRTTWSRFKAWFTGTD